MQIIVLANTALKEELINDGIGPDVDIRWIDSFREFANYPDAAAYIDLLFEIQAERIALLKKLLPKAVIINSVVHTLGETDRNFVRINGWQGFLKAGIIEAAAADNRRTGAASIFSMLNKKIEWLKDEPGFVSPRVISMIINEAYLALDENVSSKKEIDTAMKLGTNYPYGPFEWAEKIGLPQVHELLTRLNRQNSRYSPSRLLQEESR
jgi:3-hydroxybutyryl-CoA dehydrogenase